MFSQKTKSLFFSNKNEVTKKLKAAIDESGWITFREDNNYKKGDIFKEFKLKHKVQDDFQEIKSKEDKYHGTHIKYNQYYNGIRVECGQFTEHFIKGKLKTINGNYHENISINTNNIISKAEAIEIAIGDMSEINYLWEDPIEEEQLKIDAEDKNATYYPKPELVINCESKLVYNLMMNGSKSRKACVIDAINKTILHKFDTSVNCTGHDHDHGEKSNSSEPPIPLHRSLFTDFITYGHTEYSGIQALKTTWSGGLFTSSKHRLIANNYSSKIETRFHQFQTSLGQWLKEVTMNGISSTTWPITEKENTQTHWAAQKSYDYFLNVHNKSVFAGNGTIKIKAQTGLNKATFEKTDARSLTFGKLNNKYLGTMDNVGHEFTHLMTYYDTDGPSCGGLGGGQQSMNAESRNLDESFADIFGCLIERQYRPGGWDWVMGDESGLNLRNLLDPTQSKNATATGNEPQPTIYHDANWDFDLTNRPHRNAGVQNKWFTLLALGGIHNNITVQGIGIEKAAIITLNNIEAFMQRTSTYMDSRNGSVNAASNIYGNCSNEHIQTQLAWQACGVGTYAPCFTGGGGGTYRVINNIEGIQLLVSPNPAYDVINIEGASENDNYILYNQMGSIVKKGMVNGSSIDVSNIQNGYYLLKINNSTYEKTANFFKIK